MGVRMRKYKKEIRRFLRYCFLWLPLLLCSSDNQAVAQTVCADGAHQYEVAILQYATEAEDGMRAYSCTVCGDYYTEVIYATGHIWGDWVVAKDSSCTEDGIRYRVCMKYADSGHRQEEIIPASGHSYIEKTIEAACTKNGEKRSECVNCGDVYKQVLPAFGHDYGEWITVKESGIYEEEYRYRVCNHDSSHIQKEIIQEKAESETNAKPVEQEEIESVVDGIKENASAGNKKSTVNKIDIVLCSLILGSTMFFSGMVYYDFIVILWHKKKKRKYLSKL